MLITSSSTRGGHRTTMNLVPGSRTSKYVQELVIKYNLSDFEQSMRQMMNSLLSCHDQDDIVLDNMEDFAKRKLAHAIAVELELRTQTIANDKVRIIKPQFNRSIILMNAQTVKLDHKQSCIIGEHVDRYPIDSVGLNEQLDSDLEGKDCRSTASLNRMISLVPPKAQPSGHMQEFRNQLPATKLRQRILESIEENRVTIITGGTGCGTKKKGARICIFEETTQVPQFLLEEANLCRNQIRIICTQPRRLPAIAVAERVAHERGEQTGDTVGYHIRLEQKTSDNTVLTYCTSGVLLRILSADPSASGITHIILDEVHEREQNTDYLLIILREALKQRDDLKIILMSATIEGNREMFEKYFNRFKPCGRCDIPSRLYSVDKLFLPEVLALTGYMPSSGFVGLWSDGALNGFPQVDGFSEPQQQYDHLPTVRTVPDLQSYENQHPPQVQQQNGWQQPQDRYQPSTSHYHPEELTRSNTVPSNLQYVVQQNYYPNQHYYYDTPIAYVSNSPYAQPPIQQQPYMYDNSGWNMPGGYYPQNQQYHSSQQQHYQQMPMHHQPSSSMSHQQPGQMNSEYLNDAYRPKQQGIDALLNEWLPDRPPHFDPDYIPKLNRSKFDRDMLVKNYLKYGGQQWSESIDSDLALATISYCMDSRLRGSILVFLPGYDDICNLRDKVQEIRTHYYRPIVYTLHSQMNSQDQQLVFEEAKPGCRKVILSTNIAEASLTIDDVVFVIDCGKVKEKTYEHSSRISQLKISWIAKSNAEQRAGRAGRCKNGYCFRLYSQADYNDMLITQVAEMRRAAIHELCLHAKMFAPNGMTVRRFLDCAPEPPIPLAIDRSLEFLEQIGALYNYEKSFQPPSMFNESYRDENQQVEPKLTSLGRLIANLPLEPQLARLLLYGVAMSVLQPIITLVAALAHREPFTLPTGDDKQSSIMARDKFSRLDYSDHLMLLRVLNAYSDLHPSSASQFCRQNFLSKPALIMIVGIRRQLFMELKRLRIVASSSQSFDDPDYNHFSTSWPMVQGVIVAGSYPGIAFIRSGSKLRKIHTIIPGASLASLHPSSSLRRQVQTTKSEYLNSFVRDSYEAIIDCVVYQDLTKIDEGLTLRTVTAVPPLAAMLFAGPIRMQRFIVDDFELAEEDYDSQFFPRTEKEDEPAVQPPEFELDDMLPPRYQREYYVESDLELAFKGHFRDLRSALQLRYKLSNYFLRFLKCPLQPLSEADYKMLESVAQVLDLDHKNAYFNEVRDTFSARRPQRNQPRIGTNQKYPLAPFNQAQPQQKVLPSPLSIPSQPLETIQKFDENNDSPPVDPAPSVEPPTFDESLLTKQVPTASKRRTNKQEPSRSKQLIEELDRAQSKSRTSAVMRKPPHRSEAPMGPFSKGYQNRREQDPYDPQNDHTRKRMQPNDSYNDRQCQQDNNYGNNRNQVRSNDVRMSDRNNVERNRTDLYVCPPRRNDGGYRKPMSKEGSIRENWRFEDLRLAEDRDEWTTDDHRQDRQNTYRKRGNGEPSSSRGNRPGPKVFSNQNFRNTRRRYNQDSNDR